MAAGQSECMHACLHVGVKAGLSSGPPLVTLWLSSSWLECKSRIFLLDISVSERLSSGTDAGAGPGPGPAAHTLFLRQDVGGSY